MSTQLLQSASPFCKLPSEIIEFITLELLPSDPTSPASDFIPLLQTCKYLNAILAFGRNSHLYSSIFRSRFDSAAALRRLGPRTQDSLPLTHQLGWYSSALQCIRRGDIYDQHVPEAFWACFVLLTENDSKNRAHVDAAGLADFVDLFVRKRLYEDSTSTNGWPQESYLNSLALWLLWFTTTEQRLLAESPARRNEIIKLVLPFVVVPFRYPSAYAPHNHFLMPLTNNSNGLLRQSITPAHGPFPVYRSGRVLTTQFYDRFNKIGTPLASLAAKLIFFSRRQITPIGVPVHLPINREHAVQLGFGDRVGPTQEDVHELNHHKIVNLPDAAKYMPTSPSSIHDDDWYRLTDCIYPMKKSSLGNSHYTYGSAVALWQGRILVPTDNAFATILQEVQMREDFTEQQLFLNAAPLFMRLREYHCIDPEDPVPAGGPNDGFDDGISNAWMPKGVQIREDRNAGKLMFQRNGRVHTYEAYRPECSNSHDEETCRGCQYRGSSEAIYRECDDQYLSPDSRADDTVMDDEFWMETSQYDSLIDNALGTKDTESIDMEDDAMDIAEFVADDGVEEEHTVTRKCNGVLDIALVGETDIRHGQAWNHYRFYGRVREWDGLVALVRIPAQPHLMVQGLGVWVFSGYIVGGQNFVGTWRALGGVDPGLPTLESSFAMTRREEAKS